MAGLRVGLSDKILASMCAVLGLVVSARGKKIINCDWKKLNVFILFGSNMKLRSILFNYPG